RGENRREHPGSALHSLRGVGQGNDSRLHPHGGQGGGAGGSGGGQGKHGGPGGQGTGIAAEQVKNKPPQAIAKIVEGKLEKYFQTCCLVDQGFVKRNSEISVKEHLGSIA